MKVSHEKTSVPDAVCSLPDERRIGLCRGERAGNRRHLGARRQP